MDYSNGRLPRDPYQLPLSLPAKVAVVGRNKSNLVKIQCCPSRTYVKSIWGSLGALFVIALWAYNTFVATYINLYPRWVDGYLSFVWFGGYSTIATVTIFCFLKIVTSDPGRIETDLGHLLGSDGNYFTLCPHCEIKRPNRAHHCRRCGFCIRKMDHHCPWVNNCIGEDNQWMFIQLVFYAALQSGCQLLMLFWVLYYEPPCVSCDVDTFVHFRSLAFNYTSLALSISLFVSTSLLTLTQLFNVHVDRTTLELIVYKSSPWKIVPKSPEVLVLSLMDVCGSRLPWLWFVPCRSRKMSPKFFEEDPTAVFLS